MNNGSTEERLALLESEVAELKRQLARVQAGDNWFRRVSGSLKDEPEFVKVLELGRKLRLSDSPEAGD